MSDTPETDAFSVSFKSIDDQLGKKQWVPVDLARRLERERDEANKELHKQLVRFDHLFDEAEKIRIERDEAREDLEQIYQASMNARHKEEDYAEWEKAIFVLLDLCELKQIAKLKNDK